MTFHENKAIIISGNAQKRTNGHSLARKIFKPQGDKEMAIKNTYQITQ